MVDAAGSRKAHPRSPPWGGRIFYYAYNGISNNRILANAAGVTYYALLALFPGIAAVVSIYGLFADPGTIVGHVDAMTGLAPGGAIDVIRDQLTRLSAQGNTTLGASFAVGLVISLWSANSGVKALFDSLNVVYEEEENRSFIRLNAVNLVLYDRDHRVPADRSRLRRRAPGHAQSASCSRCDRSASEHRSLADPTGAGRFRADADIPVRPEP
jgi:membrane protein